VFLGLILLCLPVLWRLSPPGVVGVCLFCGGSLSNLLDRAISGTVVDFLQVGRGALRTDIFNPADVAIVLGISLVLFSLLRRLLDLRKGPSPREGSQYGGSRG